MRREGQTKLRIVSINIRQANAFVELHHRHHKKLYYHKFSLGVTDGENLRGVAMVNRPVNTTMDDGKTLEVCRVATDGHPNACSALYGAARRVAKEMGYERIITYTLPEEGGSSLRGAGFEQDPGEYGGTPWNYGKRKRADLHPMVKKHRWTAWLVPRPKEEE